MSGGATSSSSDDEMDAGDSEWKEEDDPERLWCVCRKPHDNRCCLSTYNVECCFMRSSMLVSLQLMFVCCDINCFFVLKNICNILTILQYSEGATHKSYNDILFISANKYVT